MVKYPFVIYVILYNYIQGTVVIVVSKLLHEVTSLEVELEVSGVESVVVRAMVVVVVVVVVVAVVVVLGGCWCRWCWGRIQWLRIFRGGHCEVYKIYEIMVCSSGVWCYRQHV